MKPEYCEKPECISAVPDQIIKSEFTAKSGHVLPYTLLLPEMKDGQKYPLILHLHGAGSWVPDFHELPGQCLCMVKKDYPAVVLVPKTHYPMKWADHDWTLTEHHQTGNRVQERNEMPAKPDAVQRSKQKEDQQRQPQIDECRYVFGEQEDIFGYIDLRKNTLV